MDDFMSFVPGNIAAQGAEADRLMSATQTQAPEPTGTPQADMTQPQAVPAPAVTMAVPSPSNVELMKSEQRYRVLQGKYNAETTQYRAEIEALRRELEGLKAQVQATPKLDVSEFEAQGPEIQRLAKIVADQQAIIDGLTSGKLAQPAPESSKIQQLEERMEADAQERYFQFLDMQVPGWEKVNQHPDFHAWLSQPDGMSGRTRRDSIAEAANSLNGPRVVQFFVAFRNEYERSRGQDLLPGQTGAPPQSNIAAQGFNPAHHATREQLQVAQQNFQRGRCSEEEYDATAIKFQRALRDGVLR
jgi:hypothetical protein